MPPILLESLCGCQGKSQLKPKFYKCLSIKTIGDLFCSAGLPAVAGFQPAQRDFLRRGWALARSLLVARVSIPHRTQIPTGCPSRAFCGRVVWLELAVYYSKNDQPQDNGYHPNANRTQVREDDGFAGFHSILDTTGRGEFPRRICFLFSLLRP
jgi:hypothetical protein